MQTETSKSKAGKQVQTVRALGFEQFWAHACGEPKPRTHKISRYSVKDGYAAAVPLVIEVARRQGCTCQLPKRLVYKSWSYDRTTPTWHGIRIDHSPGCPARKVLL